MPPWLRWLVGSITFLGVAILILSIVLGVRAGQRQLQIRTQQQIAISLERAWNLQAEGRIEEAFDEYRSVLVLDPNNRTATAGIQTLLDLAGGGLLSTAPGSETGQSNPGAAAAAEELSSSDVPLMATEADLALFDEAQSAMQRSDWQSVIDKLTQLRNRNSDLRTDEVIEMLYNAYFTLATEQESLNQVNEALTNYQRAVDIHPNPLGAEIARKLLAQYLKVLSIDTSDYAEKIAILEGLYEANSAYRDVETRLHEAYEEYGDRLVRKKAWCQATIQYDLAIEIAVTPGLVPKRDRYQAQCAEEDLAEPPVVGPDEEIASLAAASRQSAGVSQNGSVAAASDNQTSQSTDVLATPARTGQAASSRNDLSTDVADDRALTETQVSDDTAGDQDESSQSPAPISVAPSRPGGRILYASIDAADNRSRIYAQPADGSSAPTLLVEDGVHPAMRSDGARLIYRNVRSDSIGLTAFDPGTGLFIRLTDFAEDGMPSWSPEDNRIVFASSREGDRRMRIYTVWAEQNGATANHSFGESPSWHPTSDLIVYRGCDNSGNNCGLWLMNGNGGERRPLTSVQRDSAPSWSPSGRYIVFMSDGRDDSVELYRMTFSNGQIERLTFSSAIDGVPTVSPSGDWVAFLSNRSGTWGIWRIPLAGGEAELVAAPAGQIGEWQEQRLQWIQ